GVPSVVRAVHAAVELLVQGVGLGWGAAQVVHAQNGRVVSGVFRPARQSADAPPPGGSSVVGVPDTGCRDGERQACRISRIGADRMQAEATAAALPPRAAGLVPQCPVQVPGATAVIAAEQRSGGDAGPQDTVFGT